MTEETRTEMPTILDIEEVTPRILLSMEYGQITDKIRIMILMQAKVFFMHSWKRSWTTINIHNISSANFNLYRGNIVSWFN